MLNFDRLNNLIKEKGVPKSFIAGKLGRQRSLLNNWERGKSQPTEADLAIIAEILGTSVAYLTGESDKKEEAAHERQPLSPEKQLLLKKAGELSDEEIRKVLEYADFVKSQRKP